MLVAVKFCGGCDPEYDRIEMFQKIKKALGNKVEWTFSPTTHADCLLVINGCSRACANTSEFHISKVFFVDKETANLSENICGKNIF